MKRGCKADWELAECGYRERDCKIEWEVVESGYRDCKIEWELAVKVAKSGYREDERVSGVCCKSDRGARSWLKE